VIVATNGYTGALTPWHRRRVVPIGSYVMATEEIAPGLVDRLFPTDRILSDTRKLVYYYRPVARPQTGAVRRPGVAVGNRSAQERTEAACRELVRLFPELARHPDQPFLGRNSGFQLRHARPLRRGPRACSTPWAIAALASAWRAISARAPAARRRAWMTDAQRLFSRIPMPDPAVLHRQRHGSWPRRWRFFRLRDRLEI
jgi:hypothetical protein